MNGSCANKERPGERVTMDCRNYMNFVRSAIEYLMLVYYNYVDSFFFRSNWLLELKIVFAIHLVEVSWILVRIFCKVIN